MDAKQFAWMYLISNGRANVEPSFYGGTDVVDSNVSGKKDKTGYYRFTYEEAFLDQIKSVGVDWDKTKAPKGKMYSEFTDTFHKPNEVEYLVGILSLKDGAEQFWMAKPLISNVFEQMTNIDVFKSKFKELGLE